MTDEDKLRFNVSNIRELSSLINLRNSFDSPPKLCDLVLECALEDEICSKCPLQQPYEGLDEVISAPFTPQDIVDEMKIAVLLN